MPEYMQVKCRVPCPERGAGILGHDEIAHTWSVFELVGVFAVLERVGLVEFPVIDIVHGACHHFFIGDNVVKKRHERRLGAVRIGHAVGLEKMAIPIVFLEYGLINLDGKFEVQIERLSADAHASNHGNGVGAAIVIDGIAQLGKMHATLQVAVFSQIDFGKMRQALIEKPPLDWAELVVADHEAVEEPGQGIDTFLGGGVKRVACFVDTLSHVVRLHVVEKRPVECTLYFVFVTNGGQAAGDGAKIAHPEKVKMSQAGAIKFALPQAFDNLLANLACVAIEPFDPAKMTVDDLPIKGTYCANDTANAPYESFHWLQYSTGALMLVG